MTFKDRLLLAVAPYPWWARYLYTMLFITLLIGLWWLKLIPHGSHSSPTPVTLCGHTYGYEGQASDFFSITSCESFVKTLIQKAAQEKLILEQYAVTGSQKQPIWLEVTVKLTLTGEFFSHTAVLDSWQKTENLIIKEATFSLHGAQVRAAYTITLVLPEKSRVPSEYEKDTHTLTYHTDEADPSFPQAEPLSTHQNRAG